MALPALICLMAGLFLLSVTISGTQARILLLGADRESQFELAVLDQAKGYAREISAARLCGYPEPESTRTLQIQQRTVMLENGGTWLLVRTDKETYRLYFDAQGIVGREREE